MPDALPQGSFAFLFRQVLLFSVALFCPLPAPYASLLLQPQGSLSSALFKFMAPSRDSKPTN